jgi:hypothetical protein
VLLGGGHGARTKSRATHTHTRVCVCVCVCIYICIYICMYIYIYICINIYYSSTPIEFRNGIGTAIAWFNTDGELTCMFETQSATLSVALTLA